MQIKPNGRDTEIRFRYSDLEIQISRSAKLTTIFRKAAQYIRMSTEQQRYSTTNQKTFIAHYADAHGLEIVRTYIDEGKSGLRIQGRTGLQKLLSDVISGGADYQYILVYDVSRWGRFQDNDESAHYEFLCRRAGKKIIYCAENFPNDGSPLANIVKGLKRAMASEYSRELSEKVFRGQSNLATQGWHVCSPSPYGLRREIIDSNGKSRGKMEYGQRKSFQSDKVKLTLGPKAEIRIVQQIFFWFTTENIFYKTIADRLNSMKIPPPNRSIEWTKLCVKSILTNEKYIGTMIYNKTSERLSSPKKKNPFDQWIKKENSIEQIIDKKVFDKAQKLIKSNIRIHSEEHLTKYLESIYARHGRISTELIKATKNAPSPRAYRRVFGTIENAYAQVGYFRSADENPHRRKLFRSNDAISKIATRLINLCKNLTLKITKLSASKLQINNLLVIQLAVFSRTNAHPGYRLFLKKDADAILAFHHDGDHYDREIFLIPRSITTNETFYINKRQSMNFLDQYKTGWDAVENDILGLLKQKSKTRT